jgi:Ca2+-binding RTX toxin-like protein
MATLTYSTTTSTITFGDVATLTIGQAQIVTSSATELKVRTTVSGTLNGTLDVDFTGDFQLIGGVPAGGAFTGLEVDFNGEPLLRITDFSLPLSATQAPDLDHLMASVLGGDDVLTGAALADVLNGFAGVDRLDGASGDDVMNGNQGADSLVGGDGADVIRGGKDDDVITAGAGSDFVSGDRGNDTVTGGAGADIFHTFAGAGTDRVTDFSAAEGDRVAVLSGTTYTVSQAGADVVIDLGAGDRMILVGVQQSSLTGDWIFNI